MPMKISHRHSSRRNSYDRFKEYLHVMHEQAVEIINTLNQSDKQYVEHFFQNYYPTQKEHYWSLKKLFTLAMYIPMFLQIGMSAIDREIFDALIYIDTHAGPGLARVGNNEKDVVLGSPLLAVKWPKIIASNVPSFKKIYQGFNELYFVEKEHKTCSVLRRIVRALGINNVRVIGGDVNIRLLDIRRVLDKKYRNPLILMFVDPYGKFTDQIHYKVLCSFVRGRAVDLVYNVMSPSIARGLMSKKNNPEELRKCIDKYWGELCRDSNHELGICRCYNFPTSCSVNVHDIVEAYVSILRLNNYKTIGVVPVDYNNRVLYHLLIASKARGSMRWIKGYMEYLEEKAPRDYDTLKNLWLQATGRQGTLF